jgi:hypothetical protein
LCLLSNHHHHHHHHHRRLRAGFCSSKVTDLYLDELCLNLVLVTGYPDWY